MTGLLWRQEERKQEHREKGGSTARDRVTNGIIGHPYIWHGHPLSHHTWKPSDANSGEEEREAQKGTIF